MLGIRMYISGMDDSCSALRYDSWKQHQEVMAVLKTMQGGAVVSPPVAEAVMATCPPCQCLLTSAATVEPWWQPYVYRGGPAATLLLVLAWKLGLQWYWRLLGLILAAFIDPLTTVIWLGWAMSTEWSFWWGSLTRLWNTKLEVIARTPFLGWVRSLRCNIAEEDGLLDDQIRVGIVEDGEEPASVVTVARTPTSAVVSTLPISPNTPSRFVSRLVDFMNNN